MPNRKTFSKTALLAILISLPVPVLAGPVLKGSATQEDRFKNDASLSRGSDMTKGNDPFGSQSEQPQQVMEAPGFGVDSMKPPAPPPNLKGNAADEGDQFNGAMMNPTQDNSGGQPLQGNVDQGGQPQQPAFNPNDPDSSPDMQVAWDIWHKRVAEQVYVRFTKLSNAAFGRSRPLLASASYVVTRTGQVKDVRLLQKSWNPIFNTLVMGVINSLNGDLSVLAFPPGSRRVAVEKSGTFTQNYGMEGFKHTIGDRETVSGQQQMRGGGGGQPMMQQNQMRQQMPMQNQMMQQGQMPMMQNQMQNQMQMQMMNPMQNQMMQMMQNQFQQR
jgi:hypothetical protein